MFETLVCEPVQKDSLHTGFTAKNLRRLVDRILLVLTGHIPGPSCVWVSWLDYPIYTTQGSPARTPMCVHRSRYTNT